MVEEADGQPRGGAGEAGRGAAGGLAPGACRPPSTPSARAARVILAAAELRDTNAEARELWSRVMEGWVADVSAVIEAERARGAAPAGQPARDLAIALLQMNERAQYATFAGESPALAEDTSSTSWSTIWVRAIYGAAPEPSRRAPALRRGRLEHAEVDPGPLQARRAARRPSPARSSPGRRSRAARRRRGRAPDSASIFEVSP